MSAYIQQKPGLSGPKFSSNAGILWILARHIWFEWPEHALIVIFLLSPCFLGAVVCMGVGTFSKHHEKSELRLLQPCTRGSPGAWSQGTGRRR